MADCRPPTENLEPGNGSLYGISPASLKEMFSLSEIQEGASYKMLQAMGGFKGIARKLETSLEDGIDRATVEKRGKAFGKNEPQEKPPASFCKFVWDALEDKRLSILIGAACISLIVGLIENPSGGWLESAAILSAFAIAVTVVSTHDYRKDKQLRKLCPEFLSFCVIVLREGSMLRISPKYIVVGDIVILEAGDRVPADGVLGDAHMLAANESTRTGKSDLVHKAMYNDEVNPKESPFLMAGTRIECGSGKMIVCAVGINSSAREKFLQGDSEKAPFQVKMKITDWIETVGFYIALFTFIDLIIYMVIDAIARGSWDGKCWNGFITSFIIAVTIIVATVPVFSGFFNNSLFIKVATIIGQVLIVEFGGAALNCSKLTFKEHLYCVAIGAVCLLFSFLAKVLSATVCTDLKIEKPDRSKMSMQQT